MTNELAVVEETVTNMDEIKRTAMMLAMSGYFDGSGDFNTQVAQIGTRILAGQEMGFPPFASNTGIHIIKGKPTVGANLMSAAVKLHPDYDYRAKVTPDCVTIEFFQHGESLGESSFSVADAKAAGTQNMQKYGRNMLFARAMSNGVKWYCPDVFFGNTVYTPDELDAAGVSGYAVVEDDWDDDDDDDGGGTVINGDGEIVQDDGHGTPLPESLANAPADTAAEMYVSPPKGDPPKFSAGQAGHEEAVAWGVEQGAFPDLDEAKQAYKEMYAALKLQSNADQMFPKWIGVVTKQAAANAENAAA